MYNFLYPIFVTAEKDYKHLKFVVTEKRVGGGGSGFKSENFLGKV